MASPGAQNRAAAETKGLGKMTKSACVWLGVVFALTSMGAAAQTVTGSGTTNTVPVFTGTSTVGNSPITVSGGNVGIGTTSPGSTFQVFGSVGISSNTQTLPVLGGSSGYDVLRGNLSGYMSEMDLINTIQNSGSGQGFRFIQMTGEETFRDLLYMNGDGNVGIGTTTPGTTYANTKLEVNGYIQTDAGIYFPGNATPQTVPWTGVVCGGDYAESVDVSGDKKTYEPGDVLVIAADDGSDIAKSSEPYSTLVAGVYATKPGVVGRRQTTDAKTSTTEVPMAMVGIVPTKVSAENGPIKRGDLLVTSSTPGYAMKGTDRDRLNGTVIGKALGHLDSGTGMIEVVVSLQ
jgi:hypothetical protein